MVKYRWLKRIGIGFLLLLMFTFLVFLVFRGNIHTVVSKEVYRSAQLPPSRLRHLIQSAHIRTVINLRGANPGYRWYQDEREVSRVMGVKHYDIRLDSQQLPSPKQLRRLIHLFQTAPMPILLHCQGGADRTGFASSMYILLKGNSIAKAKRAYSWFYHVKSPRSIGKLVMPHYERWLKQYKLKTNRHNFLRWVHTTKLLGSPS